MLAAPGDYTCWCCGAQGEIDAEDGKVTSCGCSVLEAEPGGNTCVFCAANGDDDDEDGDDDENESDKDKDDEE
jgi:hypothetical protein